MLVLQDKKEQRKRTTYKKKYISTFLMRISSDLVEKQFITFLHGYDTVFSVPTKQKFLGSGVKACLEARIYRFSRI